MSLRPELQEKTKNSQPVSFPYIPEGITVNCLARLSRSHYTRLSLVSKTFSLILSSTELYAVRSHTASTEQCLYVSLWYHNSQFSEWFTLRKSPKKKSNGHLLVPIKVHSMSDWTSTVAVVGSEIYVMGGLVDGVLSSAVRIIDCRSHTWRDGPSMNVARGRTHAKSCVYDGKIYVVGGCMGVEAKVFDTKTQTWESLPNPGIGIPSPFVYRIVEIKGKICIYYSNYPIEKMYAYDLKQDKWECSEFNDLGPGDFECAIENVSYRSVIYGSGKCMLWWYDIKDGNWKEVRGLDSLSDMMSGESLFINNRLVSFDGKLLLIWEECMNHNGMKDIWCAQIKFEKRDGGDVWGNAQWVDVVHTVPKHVTSCIV